jgi:glycosyltransferase involved in cell wall biosynthesis
MGRLSPEKGVHVLLQAMSQAPELNLKILGRGPEDKSLHSMVQRLGLHNVEFMGYVSGEQKWLTLKRAQALIVPSLCYETFGVSALESLCAGTPVIASDLGSLPQLVEDGKSGLLFPPGDATALRRKLVWLSAHPEAAAQMGRYGRQVVETRYRAKAHYEQLMRIYAEVLN